MIHTIPFRLSLTILSALVILSMQTSTVYKSSEGSISFTSDAPLEMISASSKHIQGVINITDKTFAFKVPVNTFEGFNSALQKTHFNENYLETDKYPSATFEGKIIEDIDFSKPGKYQVRGKGNFTIHGVNQVRIIKCTLTNISGKITVDSEFSVLLDEFNIKIPSVVNQKIAEEIWVKMSVVLQPLKK